MRPGRLSGKSAIVTGAASGIGEATATLFALEGAQVVVADISLEGAERVARAINQQGGIATAIMTDVTNSSMVAAMVEHAVSSFGRLDIIFNNAGLSHDTSIGETTDAIWDQVVDVTLKGVFLGCRHAAAVMRKTGGGVIVNSSSTAANAGFARRSAYCAAKGGVAALTRALAVELSPDDIRVNAILPGATDTKMVRDQYLLQADPAAAQKQHRARQPIGRLSSVDDIARTVLFLASDEPSTMTGTMLTIDGGYTAG